MAHKIITKRVLPAALPLLLDHLKLDPEGSNPGLEALTLVRFGAACGFAEHYTGRAIGLQMIEKALDGFPCGPILLPLAPALSVNSITYPDLAGVVQTCAPASYVLDDYSFEHWVAPVYGSSWPAALPAMNAVKVRYQAGYTEETLPDEILSGLLLTLGHFHKNNQAVSALRLEEVPLGAVRLFNSVKLWSV